MKKVLQNKCFWLLLFLGLFGFSVGLFDNYKDLWMSTNGFDTVTISHVKSISYVVTVLILFFFTIRVSQDKLKIGVTLSLILKMITSTVLICIDQSGFAFLIKFMMFFDIALTQLILASIYPLMMNIAKDDVIYTKKSFIESFSNKLGFLLVTVILGRSIMGRTVDYNTCLLLSMIFTFLAFLVLVYLNLEAKGSTRAFDLKNARKYFNANKTLYLFLFVNFLGSVVWSTILGMPLLTLTQNLGFSSVTSSFFILGLGIVSNLLSMIVVKHMHFKCDHINLFIKYGFRVVLYVCAFIIDNPLILIITIIYLLLTDCTYNFIFSGFFINNIDEKYTMLLTTLNYCTTLIGDAIGTLICGLVFSLSIKYMVLPAIVLGIVHYVVASILIEKKKVFKSCNSR